MRSLAPTLASAGWTPAVDDGFDGPELDAAVWLPYFLPHWSTRHRSAARYRVVEGALHLLIEDDQPPWSEELDGPLRVSSLQTGLFAGPLGSRIGQHRVHEAAVVTEEWESVRLLTPHHGAFLLEASWEPHPDQMVALWLIGYEDHPERSAEICIAEIFGTDVGRKSAAIGMGLHPFGDPAILDDFEKVTVAVDVRDCHEYAAVWTAADVRFFVDGRLVKHSRQSPRYPMQVMLNIYDFGRRTSDQASSPFVVRRFRCYQPPAPDLHLPA